MVVIYGGPQLSRQIQIHCGKFKFTTANSNSLRQIQINHGKFKFTAANSNSTPYNVSSVLWRLFSALEVAQYTGGITSVLSEIASVLWRLLSTVVDSLSTMEVAQYNGQYCGRTTSLRHGDNISTLRDTSDKGIQYCGGIHSVPWGIPAVHVGDSFSTVGDTFSTVEVVQYSGGQDQYSRG